MYQKILTCPFKKEKTCLYALETKCQFEFRKPSECFLLRNEFYMNIEQKEENECIEEQK